MHRALFSTYFHHYSDGVVPGDSAPRPASGAGPRFLAGTGTRPVVTTWSRRIIHHLERARRNSSRPAPRTVRITGGCFLPPRCGCSARVPVPVHGNERSFSTGGLSSVLVPVDATIARHRCESVDSLDGLHQAAGAPSLLFCKRLHRTLQASRQESDAAVVHCNGCGPVSTACATV